MRRLWALILAAVCGPGAVLASEPAYPVGPFIDPRDGTSCAALGHTHITLWNTCEDLVNRGHKTLTWGGTTTNPYQPPGCWYYYETGQADGISLTFNAAVSGQPTDFLRSQNSDRFGFFCMGFDPPSAPPTPAPPIMPLTYGTGGDGQLSKCTRAEAETLDYMPTYNECYNLYVARGDFQGNAQMRFFEEPDPYNLDKDSAKGWCFLLVLQLEFDDGSTNQRGDMQFKHTDGFTPSALTCADWYALCYCRLPQPPSTPPPQAPAIPGSCDALVALTAGRTPVSDFGETKVFCFHLGSVVNCNVAYRWKTEAQTAVQICRHDGSGCTFDEYDAGAVCNFPPSAPPPSPLPPNAPFYGSCPDVQAVIDARTELSELANPKSYCSDVGNIALCPTTYQYVSSTLVRTCYVKPNGNCGKEADVACPSPSAPPSPPPPSPPPPTPPPPSPPPTPSPPPPAAAALAVAANHDERPRGVRNERRAADGPHVDPQQQGRVVHRRVRARGQGVRRVGASRTSASEPASTPSTPS